MPHVQWLLYYNVEYRKLLERKNEFVNVWICGSCLAYVQCMTIVIGGKLLEYPNHIGLWDAPHENYEIHVLWDKLLIFIIYTVYNMYSLISIIQTSISELEKQRKCRVKVHIVTMWPACACAVNLRRVVASWEPAAALLSSLVLMLLKSVQNAWQVCHIHFYMHDKFRGYDLGMVNIIRTVRHFSKGVRIIEVGLHYREVIKEH